MKKTIKFILLALLVFVGLGIFGIYKYGPSFNIYLKPPSPEEYVDHALRTMDMGINSQSKDWQAMKKKAKDKAQDMESFEETYELLDEASKVAGGKHSFFLRPEEVKGGAKEVNMPKIELKDGILYMKLPPIMLAENTEMQAYVDKLNKALKKDDFKGVIIDLSDNTGGDMHPMVLGLAPLIGDGKILAFKSGKSLEEIDLESLAKTSGLSYTDKKIPNKKIAVIINDMTASSGEITALAFKGMDQVKFFGSESAGYTSVNSSFSLYDGAMINLTTGSIVDKAGNEYLNDKIIPDEISESPIEDAKAYLKD